MANAETELLVQEPELYYGGPKKRTDVDPNKIGIIYHEGLRHALVANHFGALDYIDWLPNKDEGSLASTQVTGNLTNHQFGVVAISSTIPSEEAPAEGFSSDVTRAVMVSNEPLINLRREAGSIINSILDSEEQKIAAEIIGNEFTSTTTAAELDHVIFDAKAEAEWHAKQAFAEITQPSEKKVESETGNVFTFPRIKPVTDQEKSA